MWKIKNHCHIKKKLEPECLDYLKKYFKTHPFRPGTGSNDTGILRMNPVSLRILDVNTSKITTDHCFDTRLTGGKDRAKACKIFDSITSKFSQSGIPWSNCISLSVDSTSTIISCRSSVASRFLQKNPNIFITAILPIYLLAMQVMG